MYDADLDNLEKTLRRLIVGYRIYLRGKRMHPPTELTAQVERLIQKLSESAGLTFPQRYRLSTLVTRYYAYRDLWRRTPPQKEVKPHGGGKSTSTENTTVDVTAASTTTDAVRVSISDPVMEEEKIHELYDAFTGLSNRRDTSEKSYDEVPLFSLLSWPQFLRYITDRVQRIRQDTGCVAVAFTLSSGDDAVHFTSEAQKADDD